MDKATAFGLPFFYRFVVPGGASVLLALPMLTRGLRQIGVRDSDTLTGVLIVAFFAGFLLQMVDDPIYKVYEGLRLWPTRLRVWKTSRWQRRVDKLIDECKNADSVNLGVIWSELTGFPAGKDGWPYAARPTRFGNLLASYESYPFHRYGLHSHVFWPRLWPTLPRDVRESLEHDWAMVDAVVHLAGAFVVVGGLYVTTGVIALAASSWKGLTVVYESTDLAAAAIASGAALVLLSYFPYVLSFGQLRRYGDMFRSAFDVYRKNLEVVKLPDATEWNKWDQLGDDLLYAPRPAAQESAAANTSSDTN
jgi:hypothetical protein